MDATRAKQIADSFRIRGSATIEIVAGEIGLTEKQEIELASLEVKRSLYFDDKEKGLVTKNKPLTTIQEERRLELIHKRDNPELPEGAKTHCKKWLKHNRYGRWPDLKNKYITKGNEQEDEGFTLMALQLNLGMVYKNKEYRENDYACGTPDLDHNNTGHDNKCSWSLDTFPMFETEIPDQRYWWQLQNYSINWNHWTDLSLCYTLINSSEEEVLKAIKWTDNHDERYKIVERMIYDTKEFERLKSLYFELSQRNTFIEIPEEDRIKQFKFKPDKDAKEKIKQRAYMCKKYIYQLLINQK